MNLVRGGALRGIVEKAVTRALAHGSGNDGLAGRLTKEVIDALRSEGRAVRGMSKRAFLVEMERANHEILRARDLAREELERLLKTDAIQRTLLAETHGAVQRSTDAGAPTREQDAQEGVRKLFERFERGEISLDELRREIGAAVVQAARVERESLLQALTEERDRQVDVLERRISKLSHSLDLTEQALQALAARKDLDEGIASLYRTVQGLAFDAPFAAQKRALLKELYAANVDLRETLAKRAAVANG